MGSLRERVLTGQKLTVVCAGDSQVWGQGAAGWKQAMPDCVAGEPRRLPGSVPCFASMLGRCLREMRGSQKETAVINSGMGSTPVPKYLESFWDGMVMAHRPDVVILMSAINDWIEDRRVSLPDYRRALTRMADDVFAMGGELVMVTESPILGDQFSGEHYYDDYIGAFRQVAQANSRIRLADANLRMKAFLAEGDFEVNAQILYEDNWHVSQTGQFIYLKAVTDALGL